MIQPTSVSVNRYIEKRERERKKNYGSGLFVLNVIIVINKKKVPFYGIFTELCSSCVTVNYKIQSNISEFDLFQFETLKVALGIDKGNENMDYSKTIRLCK